MPLMGGMLDRKLLKDIDDFSTSEPTPPSTRQAHSKHTTRMTRRGYKFKYSNNIDSQHGERDDRGGVKSSGIYTTEGG
jgi:hypothetical protein